MRYLLYFLSPSNVFNAHSLRLNDGFSCFYCNPLSLRMWQNAKGTTYGTVLLFLLL
jgi:hypothetical protein